MNISQTNFEDDECATSQTNGRNTNPLFPQSQDLLGTSIQSLGRQISSLVEFDQAPTISEDSQTFRKHLMNLLEASNETEHTRDDDGSFIGSSNASSSTTKQSCSTSYETDYFAAIVGSSRYLMPAQSLLEEVVSVGGKAIDLGSDKLIGRLSCNGRRGALGVSPELQAELLCNGFSSATKDELQIRITKLMALLDEVERKYEQYYRQMEEVVSSFEVIAGLGAAKSYTSLSLQAISKQFSRLRDAIITQIHIANREFSQDLPRINNVLSQLSLFDQEIRQTQAPLQHQRQKCGPIRGFPENSVGFLRTWLFEHFLHPYPDEFEKLMLASQTGLTKNQVSNWFINARIRLWKPMIEEMCKEECEEPSTDLSPSECILTKNKSVSNHARK